MLGNLAQLAASDAAHVAVFPNIQIELNRQALAATSLQGTAESHTRIASTYGLCVGQPATARR